MRNFEVAILTAQASTMNSAEIDTLREDSKTGEGGARLNLDVTAVTGTTPSMTVTVHGVYTLSNGTKIYVLLDTFTAKTAAGQESKNILNCPRTIRATFTITGTTPAFTASLTGSRK